MKIEILLSTMHQIDHSIVERIGLQSDAVVVNQCDYNSTEQFEYNGHRITWINSTERGLSRSRNMALANSSADICLLVDDDEILLPGYTEVISSAFERHADASVTGFQVQGIEAHFKTYAGSEGEAGYIRSMKMASVEIAFRRKALLENGLAFNEKIGAGTKYLMGEENTLLFNCLAKGLKIYYVPQLIGKIHIGDSTWFTGYNDNYFHSIGAVFAAMSQRWSLLLIAQFAVRKHGLYKQEIGFCQAVRLMLDGRKEYLNQVEQ